MFNIRNIEEANRALRDIWIKCLASGQWPQTIPKLWPLQYHYMEPGKLLFIGLNPSHNTSPNDPMAFQDSPEADLLTEERAAIVLRQDEFSMGMHGGVLHNYFRQFHHFHPDSSWNHIDLLAIRHTKQKSLDKVLHLDADPELWSSFVRDQIELALALMAALSPPLIVIANALGSRMVKRYLSKQNPNFAMDEETGFYWIALNGQQVPLFFSGMISSGSPIDNHSLERFIWHVRRALSYKAGSNPNGTL